MNVQEPIFEGILLVDKPSGITSHDIVDRLRKKLKMKKRSQAVLFLIVHTFTRNNKKKKGLK